MCPTVLVLHFTKTHGCYTTYLQIPLGVSLTRCKTSHPQVHQSTFIFHRPSSSQNRLPTFALALPFHVSTLFSLSGLVSDWHSVSRGLQEAGALSVWWTFSTTCWSQTKHRKKMCRSVWLVVCMHMLGHSSICFWSSPSSQRCPWKEWNVYQAFCPRLLSCAPSSPFIILLSMMLLRNYRGGWGGRKGTCPFIFFHSTFKPPPLHFRVFFYPYSPPPPSSPLTPRNLVRLGSGWSRSWARCRAARLSRSLHSCRWTWGPAGAC